MNHPERISDNRKLKKVKFIAYLQEAIKNKFTYIYYAIFLLTFLVLTIIFYYALYPNFSKNGILNAYSVTVVLLLCVTILIILVKKGLFIPFLARSHEKRLQKINYKKQQLNKISDLNRRNFEQKKIELLEKIELEQNRHQQPTKTFQNNFVWYLILITEFIALLFAIILILTIR